MGEFDAETQEHGLAVTGGRVSGTGIAGLGVGQRERWLERKLGFTCDSLIRAAFRGCLRRRQADRHGPRVQGQPRLSV